MSKILWCFSSGSISAKDGGQASLTSGSFSSGNVGILTSSSGSGSVTQASLGSVTQASLSTADSGASGVRGDMTMETGDNKSPKEKITEKEKSTELILNILNGTEQLIVTNAQPGIAKIIVSMYQSIVNSIKMMFNFFRISKKAPAGEGKQTNQDRTKYIFVKFDNWVYNGSEKLWKSILIKIWDAVGQAYGYDKIGAYRFKVELERNKRGRNNDAIHSKSTHEAREEAFASFQISTILSTLFAVGTGALGFFLKLRGGDYNMNKTQAIIITVISIVIGLIPLTRQFSIFFTYILTSPFTTRVKDKTFDRREKYLNEAGFKEFVRDEFQYILDFVQYVPIYDEKLQQNVRTRLCIFVNDLDRCNKSTIMSVLEAVILLLVKAPVTCWLSLDPRLIVASIEDYGELKGILEAAEITGHDYLEKIIQLPFCIPGLTKTNKQKFASRQFLQGQLTPERLLKAMPSLSETRRLRMDHSTIKKDEDIINENTPLISSPHYEQVKKKSSSLLELIEQMENILVNGHEREFESKLIENPPALVKAMKKAFADIAVMDEDLYEDRYEDFLILVYEWIENFQECEKQSEKNDGDNLRGDQTKRGGNYTENNTSPANDVENPAMTPATSPFSTMLHSQERAAFTQYVGYIDGKPRILTRIINIYNVARYLADEAYSTRDSNPPAEESICFNKKLMKIVILCEHWPYRMSWLLQVAEYCWQEESLPKHNRDEIATKFDVLKYLLREKGGGLNDSTTEDRKSRETLLYHQFKKISLFDVHQRFVRYLIHSPDNADKYLSRDHDAQVFQQLLAEDVEDDGCNLKLIDIALPHKFEDKDLNNKFRTLRPFMVNMSRHMIEMTSKYMEKIVIHENDNHTMDEGMRKKTPNLFVETKKSYFAKK